MERDGHGMGEVRRSTIAWRSEEGIAARIRQEKREADEAGDCVVHYTTEGYITLEATWLGLVGGPKKPHTGTRRTETVAEFRHVNA